MALRVHLGGRPGGGGGAGGWGMFLFNARQLPLLVLFLNSNFMRALLLFGGTIDDLVRNSAARIHG